MPTFKCCLITVKDVRRARDFYEKLLGQRVKFDFGTNVVFHGDFAIHDEEHFSTLLAEHPIRKGGNDFELYFEDEAIEATAALLKSNSVEFLHDITVQPWQQKVLRCYDPDCNIIEIGESMDAVCRRLHVEGKSIDEINALTSLPLDFIRSALKSCLVGNSDSS